MKAVPYAARARVVKPGVALGTGLAFCPFLGEDRGVQRGQCARRDEGPMGARIVGMILGISAVGVLLGALVFGLRPEAQEPGAGEPDHVSQEEIDLYITVYTTMQADHDLTLETVLTQKSVTLAQFRSVERRVQKQDRLVRKVREALTTQAKARADALAPALAQQKAPPAGAPPGPPK
jgi:hypothetical protein